MNPFKHKRIVLGVSGSIACYKIADLASKLAQTGAQVDTVLTKSATQFITPLTFQSVTGRRAYTDDDLWGNDAHVLHVGLGHEADLLVIAPATANTMTKLALGISDSLLTVTALAATCPLLLAPAMDGGMFTHPSTQANMQTLRERGAIFVGPEEGHLASGLVAKGRMSEPQTILGQIRYALSRDIPSCGDKLAGRKVVVTAGGTREPLDPVRFLTNHSSGKQGYALAQAALDAGADVTLISTVSQSPTPAGATLVPVDTAIAMKDAVLAACTNADVLLMAAAVGDFRPAEMAAHKIKKGEGVPTIALARNPDILVEVAKQKAQIGYPKVSVGFAAETQDMMAQAQSKLERKGLDLIAANNVASSDAGFGVDTNRVTLLQKGRAPEVMPLMSKNEVASEIIRRTIEQLQND